MFNHKCAKCSQPATHKFTRIEKGQVYDIFLCPEHAGELSPYQKQQNLSEILEGLLKQELTIKIAKADETLPDLRCPACGLTLARYRKNYMLGCSECYKAFREHLIQDLRRFHGEVRHVGRKPGGGPVVLPEGEAAMAVPPGAAPPFTVEGERAALIRQNLRDLKDRLAKAIMGEDYEKAAQLRDRMRELESQLQAIQQDT